MSHAQTSHKYEELFYLPFDPPTSSILYKKDNEIVTVISTKSRIKMSNAVMCDGSAIATAATVGANR